MGSLPTIRTIYRSTDCTGVWDLANKWLDECEDRHADCAITHLPESLPTRLLDVGTQNDEIRLVKAEVLPDGTQYATLSHCWGSKPFLTLTRATLGEFLVRVPFERLSKTFRDAIIAARNLGFRYLWVR